jgi:hypothetical protein
MEADRREFLKNIGLGSMALGAFPGLLGMLSTPAEAQGGGRLNFHFVTVANAGTGANTHLLASFGQGHFDPRPGARVDGRGGFFHFRPAAAPPFPLVASGRWEARQLVSYKQLGTYGIAAAGMAEIVADIFREVPSPAVIRGAALTIVCNIGAAGLANPGEIEGVKWSFPGTDFSAGGNPGPFRQTPSGPPAGAFGLTVFTTVRTV